MRAKLTVAIPTYNGAAHVGEALRSVIEQWMPPPAPDIVIVDDRSSDATLDVVRQIGGDRVRIEVNSERLGLAGNWNRCVAIAESPFVTLFHQDDVMLPGHLATHLSYVSNRQGLGFVCGAFDVIDGAGKPVARNRIERFKLGGGVFGRGAFVRELAWRNPVRCSTATLSKEAHASVGGFDPHWRYALDWHYWFRVAARYAVGWVGTPSVRVRWHDQSETARFRSGTDDIDEVAALLAQIHAWGEARWRDSGSLQRNARRRLARAYLNRAYEATVAGDRPLALRALGLARASDRSIGLALLGDPRLGRRLAPLWFRKGDSMPGSPGHGSAPRKETR